MSEFLVSILIPAFNAGKWIREAVKSALDQTWPKKEIIVVDDGSSDDTLTVARRLESKSVKVLNQENLGASAARNKALSIAEGDYIQWLDADDLLAPDKITCQLKCVKGDRNTRVLLSSRWGRFYSQPQKAKFCPNSLWKDSLPTEWILNTFNENAWMSIESWLVSRKLTEVAGPWNQKLSMDDDGEYFLRVVSASEKIIFSTEAKSYCRRGNIRSLSSDIISEKNQISEFQSVYLQIKYLRSLEDSERTRAACLKYLQTYLIYFYPDHNSILERAYALAEELGGRLSPPVLKWKYSIIQQIFGWKMVKRAQRLIPKIKLMVQRE
jgi:glycosyltransferase involved in cell wall biosynthesis